MNQLNKHKTKMFFPISPALSELIHDWDKMQFVGSLVIIGLILLSPLVVKSPWWLNMIIVTSIFAYFGLAWNIVGGFAGQLLIGFGSLVGVGAYTTMILYSTFGISPWLGFFASVLSSILVAIFIAFITLRYGLKLDYFALFSLALMVMLGIVYSKFKITGGPMGMGFSTLEYSFKNVIFETKAPYVYLAGILLLFGCVIHYLLYRSKAGRYLIAIRENEEAAETLGVNLSYYKTLALIIAGGLAGLGGGIYIMYTAFIYPFEIFSAPFNVSLLVAPIIGGRGSLIGPIVGAILNKPIAELVRARFAAENAGVTLIVYGTFIMTFALFLPRGISGWLQKLYFGILNRIIPADEK